MKKQYYKSFAKNYLKEEQTINGKYVDALDGKIENINPFRTGKYSSNVIRRNVITKM